MGLNLAFKGLKVNVFSRSNDVSVMWCSLIEPKRVARNATNTSNKLRVVYDYIIR